MVRQATESGSDPVAELRNVALAEINGSAIKLDGSFSNLEREFSGEGIFAHGVRSIIAGARSAMAKRCADPFFELDLVEATVAKPESFETFIRQIVPCAVLQVCRGDQDQVLRDSLCSFHPVPGTKQQDPENCLRVVHAVFDFMARHRTHDGFRETAKLEPRECPFYTCCDLKLRRDQPDICRSRPYESADWRGWDTEDGACWYAVGVRVSRPPKRAG